MLIAFLCNCIMEEFMGIGNILSLLGGLALFLYGMHMMSEGLEATAGDRLKGILEKLTSNLFMAVFIGAVITALVQSSSATTVMTVGFVSAGLMTLKQAVGVIMGANIGTTITGVLIALDMGEIAPLLAFVGVVFVTFVKNKKFNSIGLILAGLGILFIGMDAMSASMSPLRDEPSFIAIMTTFNNPFFSVMAGALFTAIIQSSSASIGILQTLAMSNLISLGAASFVLFGQNIGTCITAVLSSLHGSKDAKRVAVVHLLFNCIGAFLFIGICLFTPLISMIEGWFPSNPAAQIANMHIFFNITTTVILLPFSNVLVKISTYVLKDSNEEENSIHITVPNMRLGSVTVALFDVQREIDRMFKLCYENVSITINGLITREKTNGDIQINEDNIDLIHHEIIKTIPKITSLSMSIEESKKLNILYKLNGDIERIGDHALNLNEELLELLESDAKFSEYAIMELEKLQKVIMQSLEQFDSMSEFNVAAKYEILSKNEYLLDELCESFRIKQMERLKSGCCDANASVLYSEILINIERIGDHIFNIAGMLYTGPKKEDLS